MLNTTTVQTIITENQVSANSSFVYIILWYGVKIIAYPETVCHCLEKIWMHDSELDAEDICEANTF